MKIASVLFIALAFGLLVRRNLLQVDLTFPWFLAIVVLGLASTSNSFVRGLADVFGVVSDAMAVILIAMGLMLAIITTLAIALSRIRARQIAIVRKLASQDLMQQAAQKSASLPS